MLFDRRTPIAALVCSAGVMFAGSTALAQAPAPATLDAQLMQRAEKLSDEGKHAEAAAVYEELVKKYAASPFVPEANFRAGYAYYNAGNFDAAVAGFKKVLDDKKSPPELAELAFSLTPQVLAAKAAKLPAKDPGRIKALEDAVKQFDLYLIKYPASDEVESANYGKALALYQIGKYEDAATALKTNMQKFPASPTVQDSQYLLALTLGTIANVAMQNATGENKAAEAQYDEGEKLLRDIITRRQNLALANDAQFQVGELLLARGGTIADKEKQGAVFGRALDAYRTVQTKEYVVQAQQQRVEFFKKEQIAAGQRGDVANFKKLKRVVEKEQEKLAQFQERGDETVTAKIKCGQIFAQLGKPDETRMVMNYIDQAGLATADDQKKLVLYHIARSYALQYLAPKAVEKYDAFQAAYKGDPIAQDLPLLIGAMYLKEDPKLKDPDKATKYFDEAVKLYPGTKAAAAGVLMQAQAMIQLKRYDDALKVLNETLAKNPAKDLAVDAEFYRSAVYADTGKTAEAITGYKKVRDTYPGTPQAEQSHFQVGYLLSATDAKAAIGELQSFIGKFANSPLVPAAVFALGNAQSATGLKDAALGTFKDLAAKYPKSEPAPYGFFERAKILAANQKFDECLAVMREFIKGYPENPALFQAYDFIAQIQTSQSKGAEALATYEEFVEKHAKDPSTADALLKLSTLWKGHTDSQGPYLAIEEAKRVEWRKGVEKSTAAAERILTEFPDSPAVALALKNLLDVQRLQQVVKLKSEADVEKYFESLAGKFASHPGTKAKIVFTLAAFTFEKDKAKAVQQMGSAYKPDLKFAPDDIDLYGQALIEAKKNDEAITVYEKLGKDYPLSPSGTGPRDVQEAQAIMLAGLGKAMQEKGDKEGGGKKFAELEKLYGWSKKMLEVHYGIALDLHEKKQDEEAEERLRKVLKAQEATPELRAKAMLLLGRIYEDNGRFAEAIDTYVKISTHYSAIQKPAAEGLWRGAQLLEKQAEGKIPMPTPPPAPKVQPKVKPGASKK
jgi:TolA-binding protein